MSNDPSYVYPFSFSCPQPVPTSEPHLQQQAWQPVSSEGGSWASPAAMIAHQTPHTMPPSSQDDPSAVVPLYQMGNAEFIQAITPTGGPPQASNGSHVLANSNGLPLHRQPTTHQAADKGSGTEQKCESIMLGGVRRRVELLLMGADQPPPTHGQLLLPPRQAGAAGGLSTNPGAGRSGGDKFEGLASPAGGDLVSRDQLRAILRTCCRIPVKTYFCACELDSGDLLVVSNSPQLLYRYQEFFALDGFEQSAQRHVRAPAAVESHGWAKREG